MQFLKSRPDEGQVVDSLKFLLAAMGALKRRNPLTESFLVQLDVDLEALGTRIPKLKSAFIRSDSNMVGQCKQFDACPLPDADSLARTVHSSHNQRPSREVQNMASWHTREIMV